MPVVIRGSDEERDREQQSFEAHRKQLIGQLREAGEWCDKLAQQNGRLRRELAAAQAQRDRLLAVILDGHEPERTPGYMRQSAERLRRLELPQLAQMFDDLADALDAIEKEAS